MCYRQLGRFLKNKLGKLPNMNAMPKKKESCPPTGSGSVWVGKLQDNGLISVCDID